MPPGYAHSQDRPRTAWQSWKPPRYAWTVRPSCCSSSALDMRGGNDAGTVSQHIQRLRHHKIARQVDLKRLRPLVGIAAEKKKKLIMETEKIGSAHKEVSSRVAALEAELEDLKASSKAGASSSAIDLKRKRSKAERDWGAKGIKFLEQSPW